MCTLCARYMYAMCTLCAQSVHNPCTLHAQSVHAPCLLRSCSVHATCLLSAPSVHAPFMHRAPYVLLQYLRYHVFFAVHMQYLCPYVIFVFTAGLPYCCAAQDSLNGDQLTAQFEADLGKNILRHKAYTGKVDHLKTQINMFLLVMINATIFLIFFNEITQNLLRKCIFFFL